MTNLPLYLNIANQLKDKINNNYYDQSGILPSEIELSKIFGVSRVTIRKAIDVLFDEGLVVKKQGSGTYIKKNGIVNFNLHHLKSFKEEMEELGYNYENKILEFSIVFPNEFIQNKLNLKNNEKVYFIKRVKFINSKAAVLEQSFLPLCLFPDLTYEDMIYSKYNYIEKSKKLTNFYPNYQIEYKALSIEDMWCKTICILCNSE